MRKSLCLTPTVCVALAGLMCSVGSTDRHTGALVNSSTILLASMHADSSSPSGTSALWCVHVVKLKVDGNKGIYNYWVAYGSLGAEAPSMGEIHPDGMMPSQVLVGTVQRSGSEIHFTADSTKGTMRNFRNAPSEDPQRLRLLHKVFRRLVSPETDDTLWNEVGTNLVFHEVK